VDGAVEASIYRQAEMLGERLRDVRLVASLIEEDWNSFLHFVGGGVNHRNVGGHE